MPGNFMLLVLLPSHLPAGLLEGFQPAFRPAPALCHRVGQQSKGLRVVEHSLNAPFECLFHEFPGIIYARVDIQNGFHVLVRKRVEP